MANIEDSKYDINFSKFVEGMSPVQMSNFFQLLQTETVSKTTKSTVEENIDEIIRTIYALNLHLLSMKSELIKMFDTLSVYDVTDKEYLLSIQTLIKTYNLTLMGCINTVKNTDDVLSSQLKRIRNDISNKNNNL